MRKRFRKTLENKIHFEFENPESFNKFIPLIFIPNTEHNKNWIKERYNKKLNDRTFVTANDIHVTLSDGRLIVIPSGFLTDLISIPKWLWSFFSPIDSLFIGDLIHDYLYVNKIDEIKHFDNNIFIAQKFADEERNRWRKKIAQSQNTKKYNFKNWLTHKFLRLFAKDFYNKKFSIPN